MIRLEIIKIHDKQYPELLRRIKNPPKQLYVEGNIELLKTNIIAIIGSRSCSENGIMLTNKFAKELVYQGITISSGMALGIDTIAHKTAIQEKGKTIAVLGSGFEHIFPKQNIKLYSQIIQQGGLVITEYPPEETVKSKNFLERNRIISGISLGILVIEAAYRSGTSVTAKLAIQQERKVFALPHELEDKHGIGTNQLIKKGAKMVTDTKDIIKEFPFLKYKKYLREIRKDNYKKICNNEAYKDIYEQITEVPISLNDIYRKTNKKITEINNILLMLELEGFIKKVAGGYVCILEKK